MMTTLTDLSAIVGGTLHGADAPFSAVSTDTRTLGQGEVFFALRGARFNAAEFVAQAAELGAAGAVVDQPVATELPRIAVSDTRIALADFAREWRKRRGVSLIGITGSNGKTTVKELTAGICRVAFADEAVLATAGNFNNEIGLPLTLLRLRDQHNVAVVEMGASQPGDISLLADIALPDVAVITNVARAHIEGFGSIETVARTKGEMLDKLAATGTAVLNHDDVFFTRWQQRAAAARIVSFGLSAAADYRADNIQPVVRKGRPGFELHCPAGAVAVVLPLAGRHNVVNALAAAAAAMAAGATLEHVRAGLAMAQNVPGRLRAFRGPAGAMIFDDSYNANPDSVAAAIAAMAEFKGEAWLLLGDMGELGEDAVELHQETGRLARESGAAGLLCIGELGKEIGAGFGPGARWFKSQAELEAALRDELIRGRNVLIKASRFMGLDRLVASLETAAAEAAAAGKGED